MTFRERVAVHNDAAHVLIGICPGEKFLIIVVQSGFLILQHQDSFGFCQRVKSAGCKEHLVFRSCDHEEIVMPCLKPVFDKSGHETSESILTSETLIHRKAF